jgi:hypothetical protein
MLNILLDQTDVTKALMGASDANVLEAYVTEMLRIDPPIQGIYREAKTNEVVGSTSVTAGDLVFLDVTTANKNVRLEFFFSVSEPFSWYFRSVRLHNQPGSITLAPRRITSAAIF